MYGVQAFSYSLFDRRSKPEAFWGGKSQELGEERILTVGAQYR